MFFGLYLANFGGATSPSRPYAFMREKKLVAEAAESPTRGIPPAPASGTRPCNSLLTIYVANPPNKIKANLVDYSLLTNWNFYYIFGLGLGISIYVGKHINR